LIAIAFTRLAVEDVQRARAAIIETHPGGPEAGERLADDVAARLARAIEGLGQFPRVGHPGAVPGVLEIVVPGPTRRLTFTIGYRLRDERITILGITWGGRTFGTLGRQG
jgi:plasmid stabilization system protein ParE